MVGDVGVEVGLGAFHREHADHAGLGELMQRVVDGCQRNRHAGDDRLFMQFFNGQVTVALGEDQIGKRDTLTRRAQTRAAQSLFRTHFGCFRHQGAFHGSRKIYNTSAAI
ncbi:hypothetical protein D3C87_1862840 [compost metagenome]